MLKAQGLGRNKAFVVVDGAGRKLREAHCSADSASRVQKKEVYFEQVPVLDLAKVSSGNERGTNGRFSVPCQLVCCSSCRGESSFTFVRTEVVRTEILEPGSLFRLP